MRKTFFFVLPSLFLWVSSGIASPPVSEKTQECLSCHATVTPGIVADWERSLHSRGTPAPGDQTNADACFSCHGTVIGVSGIRKRETAMGEMEFPVLSGWPNQGVGRINPAPNATRGRTCPPTPSTRQASTGTC